jgi:hypothetical protein
MKSFHCTSWVSPYPTSLPSRHSVSVTQHVAFGHPFQGIPAMIVPSTS